MGKFAIDLEEYAKRTGQHIDNAVRKVVMTCATLIDERSPVGKAEIWANNISRAARGLPPLPKGYLGGHFRINNQYRFNSAPAGIVEGQDPTGSATLGRINAEILASPVAGMHYIGNNVPYAMRLENGHSSQAPNGIYGLAAIDTANAAKKVFR